MGGRASLVVVGVMLAAPRVASADGFAEAHTLRSFYLGLAGGVAMGEDFDELLMKDKLAARGAVGVNAGLNTFTGPAAVGIDGYVLPISNTYVARGSVVLGHRWVRGYAEPCAAPVGMRCTATFTGRPVRSIVGLKLGGAVGGTPNGAVTTVEVGLAVRSQFAFELAFLYDPLTNAPGGSMDLAVQFRSFYFGMQVTAIADQASSLPLSAVMNLGYAWYPW